MLVLEAAVEHDPAGVEWLRGRQLEGVHDVLVVVFRVLAVPLLFHLIRMVKSFNFHHSVVVCQISMMGRSFDLVASFFSA